MKFSNYSRRIQIKALRKKSGKKIIEILGQKIDQDGNLLPTYKVIVEGTTTNYQNIDCTNY